MMDYCPEAYLNKNQMKKWRARKARGDKKKGKSPYNPYMRHGKPFIGPPASYAEPPSDDSYYRYDDDSDYSYGEYSDY
jgi:hypothetical protein